MALDLSVSPNAASGPNQTFSLLYSAQYTGASYTDLSWVFVLFNSQRAWNNACYVLYSQTYNLLFLMNDAGTERVGSLTPGTGTLSNSQCTVNGAGTTVSGSGPTLTLNLSVSAAAGFLGTKNIYMWAQDSEWSKWSNSDWQAKGTWTPAPDTAPTADSVSPAAASGPDQTFTLNYSTHNGKPYTDLSWVFVVFNLRLGWNNACYVLYSPTYNVLFLMNDAGTERVGSLTPGTGTLSNSQCTVNGTGTTVSGSGPTLTLTLSVNATAGFFGTKNSYMWTQDNEGLNSGWQTKGTWTLPPNTPPTADSVSPTAATGVNHTFTSNYSTHNGKSYTDLIWVYVRFDFDVHGCLVGYYQPTASLFLRNDASTAWQGPLVPGTAGTLSNPQCTVNGVGTKVFGSNQTLTLNLSLSATALFVGTQRLYMDAVDSEGSDSGWQQRGTWTPAADTPPHRRLGITQSGPAAPTRPSP